MASLISSKPHWYESCKDEIIDPYISEDKVTITINKTFYNDNGETCRIIFPEKNIIIEEALLNTGPLTVIGRNIYIKHMLASNSEVTIIAFENVFLHHGIPFTRPSESCMLSLKEKIIPAPDDLSLVRKIRTFMESRKDLLIPFLKWPPESMVFNQKMMELCPQ